MRIIIKSTIPTRQCGSVKPENRHDWRTGFGGTSRLLQPRVEALRRHVMAGAKLHMDDTPIPVLSPG